MSAPIDRETEVRDIFDELQKNAQIETGFGEKHEARRYRQIAPYVDRMGGWANYSYWIAVHGESHFNALTKAAEALKNLYKHVGHDWCPVCDENAAHCEMGRALKTLRELGVEL